MHQRTIMMRFVRPHGRWPAPHRFLRPISAAFSTTLPPLTSSTHPSLKRDPRFSVLSEKDITFFSSILRSNDVVTDEEALLSHNLDWTHRYRGASKLLLKPRSVEEISAILRYCNERKLAIVPQGGNTGLVGGSIPVFDEIILSLAHLDKILTFDPVSSVLICEAGCILQTLDEHLRDQYGHCMPLDLGAKGSCQIGGNVATNAGGLRLLRYGSLHGSVLGLEAVLPDGTTLDTLSTLRKDNTGLDLKQLFIGSEGTLGIVTKVAVAAPYAPVSTDVLLLSLGSFEAVQQVLRLAKLTLSDLLSAFEFWDAACRDIAFRHHRALESDFGHLTGPFVVLIETQNFCEGNEGRLTAFLEQVLGAPEMACQDGLLAQTEAQRQAMWRYRECLPEVCTREGDIFKYDLSLPTPLLYAIVPVMRQRLAGLDATVVGYGHVGDGNLHLNVMVPAWTQQIEALMEPFVFEYVQRHRGSISAEHGIGLMKAKALSYSKDQVAIGWMQRVKGLFDPHGIMNPYKVLP